MTSQKTLSRKKAIGTNGQLYTESQVRNLIATNDVWLYAALKFLFAKQTQDEQAVNTTRYTNRVGFSQAHASKLSYYAKWILSGRQLSGNHLIIARKYASKYAGQVLQEIKRKAEMANTPLG